MIESIHIVWLALFGLLTLAFGAVGGFLFYKIRLHHKEVELGEEAQRLREKRVELQREAYQTSTSSFYKKSGQDQDSALALEEMLKQREHELSLLEQESQMELRILREQNEMLQEELNELISSSYPYGHHVEPGLFEDLQEKQDVDEAKEDNEMVEEVDISGPEPIHADLSEGILEADSEESDLKEAELDSLLSKNEGTTEVEDENNVATEVEDENDVATEVEDENEFAFHWTVPPTITPSIAHFEPAVVESKPEPIAPDNPKETLSQPINSEGPATAQEAAPPLPVFKHVVAFVPTTPHVDAPAPPEPPMSAASGGRKPSLQDLAELGPDQFELLQDLGYATPERIASLNNEEISRLSSIFRIPDTTIRSAWIPSARRIMDRE